MLLSRDDKFNPVEAKPFIVEVSVVPDRPSVLLLMIGTVPPVTPLTVVLMVLALEVLLTPDTAADVTATPFTVDVNVFVDRESELVVPIDEGLTQRALPLASLCRT